MIYWIFSGIGIISLLVTIVLLFCGRTKYSMLISCLMIVSLSLIILDTPSAIILSIEAKESYAEMLDKKEYIETNYNSKDILTSLEVHEEYFQYQFKLERMKESKECGIFSMYYNYDIDTLELEITSEGD